MADHDTYLLAKGYRWVRDSGDYAVFEKRVRGDFVTARPAPATPRR